MLRGQGFQRLDPAKKDPKKKVALSAATFTSRLRQKPQVVPSMGKRK
jgi:hypothetical protein